MGEAGAAPGVGPRTLDEEVTLYLSGRPEVLDDPYPLYRRLREGAPVYAHGAYTIVSRFADVRALYRDSVHFKKSYFEYGTFAREVESRVPVELRPIYDEVSAFEGLFISRVDDDVHARLRRIAERAFTPRMIARMERFVRAQTGRLLDDVSGQDSFDLIDRVAYRLPLLAIAEMLGVPAADADLIHGWSMVMGAFEGRTNMDALAPWHDALGEFRAYVGELVRAFAQAPPDTNLVTALIDAHQGERLGAEELLAMFVVLLFAGHETTSNLIGNGTLALLRQREQWELLCQRPGLAPLAVEELLRYDAPVQHTPRVPVTDVQLGAVTIPAGQTTLLLIASANRDETAFSRPDTLDITRDPNRHLSFAIGPRFCLGAALARLEGRIVFDAMARRFPRLELAGSEPQWGPTPMLRGLRALTLAPGVSRG